MRPFFQLLGAPALLALSSSSAAIEMQRVADPVCRVALAGTATGTDPPAWLLLAGAVVLLGAGRVAAS